MLKVHQLVIIVHIRILLQRKDTNNWNTSTFLCVCMLSVSALICQAFALWFCKDVLCSGISGQYSSTTFNSHTIGTNFQKQLVLLNYSVLSLEIFARCVTSLVLYFFGHLQFSSYITFAVWSNGSPWCWLFVFIQYMTCLLVCSLIKWTVHLT